MENISNRIEQAARKFLSTGHINGVDPSDLASACSQIIRQESESSLSRALKTARKFERSSKKQNSDFRYTALRALARVNHLISRYKDAEKAYLEARRMAKSKTEELASIDRALIDLYMYLGKFSESKRRAKMAISGYKKLKATSDLAKTTVNYANLLHRQDKHRDAEKLYHQAADYFESLGDQLALARCFYNRANTLVQLFDLDQAEKLYLRSHEIYLQHGHTIDANDAMYGLAWLKMLKGEYHIALLGLTDGEKIYREAGHTRMAALCELDRAEVFLNLNLFIDALDSAKNAEQAFDSLKIRYESSKAALFRAKAAHALEHKIESSRALKKAQRGFAREKNEGFSAAAHLLKTQIKSENFKSDIYKAADKFKRSQLPLWEAISCIYMGSFESFRTRALKRLQKNSAVKVVPHLFAQWQTLKGDEAQSKNKPELAKKYWRIAANSLDRVRAQLPPVELRTNFGAADLSPHRRLITAEADSRPLHAAVWSEKFKTAGVWSPLGGYEESKSERISVEKSLVDLANRVSAYSHQIKGIAGERGNLAPQSQSHVTDLQRKVRQKLAAIEKESTDFSDDKNDLLELFRKESKRQPVVQFHVGNNDILAFVHQDGETILKRFPDGRPRLSRLLRQWRFLLEHELLQKHLGAATAIGAEHKLFDELGEWLWSPLEISAAKERVLILPEGELANLPWQALRLNGRPLVENYRFVLAPSLRHYRHAQNVKVDSRRVQVHVGISDDLPQIRKELQMLSTLKNKQVEILNPSKRDSWPASDSAALWHYSGHAYLRSDNPFYSYLALADGPLFAADFRLKNSQVELVTLAACRSGEQVALSGEEATGLVRSILEMGARNVIAGHWPVADDSTALWMDNFYSAYFDQKSLSESAQKASLAVREKYQSAYHWSAFSIFGAGDRGLEIN